MWLSDFYNKIKQNVFGKKENTQPAEEPTKEPEKDQEENEDPKDLPSESDQEGNEDPKDRPLESDPSLSSQAETPQMKPEERIEENPEVVSTASSNFEKIVVTANGTIKYVVTKPDHETVQNDNSTNTEKIEESTPSSEKTTTQNTEQKPDLPKEYRFPPLQLLYSDYASPQSREKIEKELLETAEKLEMSYRAFGYSMRVVNIARGPVFTCYEMKLDTQGVMLSKIKALSESIQMSISAKNFYIEAPIPGKSVIGVYVQNRQTATVGLRKLLMSDSFKEANSTLAVALGMDLAGNPVVEDLAEMPHLLIAGTTGSGKSVCIHSMLMSIIYHAKPSEVKMILIDPKCVELKPYESLPHLLLPVITDPKKAPLAFQWACKEMDRRYEIFSRLYVRNIDSYNEYVSSEQPLDNNDMPYEQMPKIVIICDEISDVMAQAGKEIEESLTHLARKAGQAGIHLVIATEMPKTEVLSGTVKASLPSRIAFKVNSRLESRTILDMNGAEELVGEGDMLYIPRNESRPLRVQGAYVSEEEIRCVMNYLSDQGKVLGDREIHLMTESRSLDRGYDKLLQDCGRFIIATQKPSIGGLQRKFSIGFNRAAQIMDELAEYGVVGEEEGFKPRKILMNMEQFEAFLSGEKEKVHDNETSHF